MIHQKTTLVGEYTYNMDNPVLGSPETRFQAALTLATTEFQGNIDAKGYGQIPNPYYSQIYASAYFDLVEDVVNAVRMASNGDELFSQVIQISKKHSDIVSEDAVESGKRVLADQTGDYPEEMPEPDEYEKIQKLWEDN